MCALGGGGIIWVGRRRYVINCVSLWLYNAVDGRSMSTPPWLCGRKDWIILASVLYFLDIPSVHAIWFATLLSITCKVFIIPYCATACSLHSVADVAHHLSVFLSIVMVRMCCSACPVTLCSVA